VRALHAAKSALTACHENCKMRGASDLRRYRCELGFFVHV